MHGDNFYSQLPSREQFSALITNPDDFVSVPPDWYIIITDVAGSTKAIEAGRYKDVNILGACSIISIFNIADSIEIPFIFGGDGASLLLPPSLVAQAKQVLMATQQLARQQFNLDLRVGIVPVSLVKEANYDIKVAKWQISPKYKQAIFIGGGMDYAEKLIKNPATSHLYNLSNTEVNSQANFAGLVCPWQDIPSPDGEIVSLIVKATPKEGETNQNIYRYFFEQIDKLYPQTRNFHPVRAQNLALTFQAQDLASIAKVHARSSSWLENQWEILKMKISNLLILGMMKLKIKFAGQDLSQMREGVVADTDYIKFDDTLRMVITAKPEQRKQINDYLEQEYQKGKLVYGLHVSNRALMTCIISDTNNFHVGLLDGADGGYALAAKAMKQRMGRVANAPIQNSKFKISRVSSNPSPLPTIIRLKKEKEL